ncbi:MAG: YbaB/EbfC family nucleoid-associated protein [candidate division KSB1 bacterium]|nr:YbaB/EbfC family nucleoid-associated protein [candidate division KSB1 bacterium]
MAKGGMGGLLQQAQKMQKEMERIQNELAEMQITGTAGGGMVTAVVTGQQKVLEIKIDPEAVDPDDVEMLEDLVLAAVNQAMQNAKSKSEEMMGQVAGGMPPGMKLPGM